MEKSEISPHSNFGINILKFLAIFFQIEVHAYSWLSVNLHGAAESVESVYQAKLLLLKGGFSMLVPITAAAVFRMTLPLTPGAEKLTPSFYARSYWGLLIFLAFVESTKEALVYGWGGFFAWNALHLIALCFLIILVVCKYSVRYLWVISLGTMLLTPLLLKILIPYDESRLHRVPIPPLHNVLAPTYLVLFLAILLFTTFKIWRTDRIDPIHKKRALGIATIVAILGSFLCLQIPFKFEDTLRLETLGMGIVAGDGSGAHIWGFFPWGGMIILGFLIYDLMLRFKASLRFLLSLFVSGLACVSVFYYFLSDQMLAHCSSQLPTGGFNALCFNRTPEQTLLVIGIFLMVVPVCVWLERFGFENGLVRSVSRSILWIYIFETSVLLWLSKLWIQHVPADYLVGSFTIFALVSCCALGLLIDRSKFSLAVTFKKNEQ